MAYAISAEIEAFKNNFESRHPDSKLDMADWLRCSYAQELVVGNSMLEVGPGVGMMLHAVKDIVSSLTAIDIHKDRRAHFPDSTAFIKASIVSADLEVGQHDTVVCMEVIEHLETAMNAAALANLRRFARRRLIISTPFNEPDPMWHHDKPGGHRQRFTLDKLSSLFPSAYATILPRYGIDWILLVEDRERAADRFSIISRADLKEVLRG